MKWQYYNPEFEYEKTFYDLQWPWAGHKYFVYDLIRNTNPEIIVELGTHKGTSLFSMAQAVKDSNVRSSLYAIDTWQGDRHAGYYDEVVYTEVGEIYKKYYPSLKIKLVRKTFDQAVILFQDNSIDLLHIDGLHTSSAVTHDFNTWLPKVKQNGVILLHDIVERRAGFGVYRLWDVLKKQYETYDFFHSHGLGVLWKEKKINILENTEIQAIWRRYYQDIFDKEKQKFAYVNVNSEMRVIMNQNEKLRVTNKKLEYALQIIKSTKLYTVWKKFQKMKRILRIKK